jgi:hypothetical protein
MRLQGSCHAVIIRLVPNSGLNPFFVVSSKLKFRYSEPRLLVALFVQKTDFHIRDSKMKCKLGLSLKDVRGPLKRSLCRCMVFHRFGHATYRLDATLLCSAHRDNVLVAHQFFAVSIDTLNASMHRTQSVLPNLQLLTYCKV